MSVTIERSWIVSSNSTSKLMPATAAPCLIVQQELELLLKLLVAVGVLGGDELDVDLVGRVLDDARSPR